MIDHASRGGLPGLLFTFTPEKTVRPGFVPALRSAVDASGGQINFVELVCSLAELPRRLDRPSRSEHRKLTSVPLFEQLHAEGSFDSSSMPQATLTNDTSLCTALEAAARISDVLGLESTAGGSRR